jgi:hypothetical protein
MESGGFEMKSTLMGHHFGEKVIPADLLAEAQQAIANADVKSGNDRAPDIRAAILGGLAVKGWSGEVALSSDSEITITSVKSKIGLCLQTGNVSRMYADLMKLQKLYVDGAIIAGIVIVPSAQCAKKIGSNVANAMRLSKEIKIFERVITAPLVILSME